MNDQGELLGGMGVDRAAADRELLGRIRRGEGVAPKERSRAIAHGLAYIHTADGTLRLTPPGREKAQS